jgi:Putative metal-binding motif
MMTMQTCPTCQGFVPPTASACVHCDAEVVVVPRPSDRRSGSHALRQALGAAAGGALAFTLMACYGAAYRDMPAPPTPRGDCDGSIEDIDGDGWCAADCDETNPDIFPGAADPVADGLDQDCDGEDGGEPNADPVDDSMTIAE